MCTSACWIFWCSRTKSSSGCRAGEAISQTSSHEGSATESAALLDVCLRLRLIGDAEYRTGKAMVVRVVSMLIKLAMSFEDARPAPDESGGV